MTTGQMIRAPVLMLLESLLGLLHRRSQQFRVASTGTFKNSASLSSQVLADRAVILSSLSRYHASIQVLGVGSTNLD